MTFIPAQNPELAIFKCKSAQNAPHSVSKSDFFSKTYQKVILSKNFLLGKLWTFIPAQNPELAIFKCKSAQNAPHSYTHITLTTIYEEQAIELPRAQIFKS